MVVDVGGGYGGAVRLRLKDNGIAAIPGTDQYWLTGKLWPTSFRVRFVPR